MEYDLRPHAAHRLDAERERGHVEQQHLAVAGDEDVGLNGGAERHDLVRVQFAVRRPAEQLFDLAANERNTRGAADQHDFVDLRRLQPGIGQRLTTRAECPLDDRRDQRLELDARDAVAVDRRLVAIGQFQLGLDGGLADLLNILS